MASLYFWAPHALFIVVSALSVAIIALEHQVQHSLDTNAAPYEQCWPPGSQTSCDYFSLEPDHLATGVTDFIIAAGVLALLAAITCAGLVLLRVRQTKSQPRYPVMPLILARFDPTYKISRLALSAST